MRRAVFNMRDERPTWAPPDDLPARLRAALPDGWELVDVATPVSGRGDGSGTSAEALRAIDGAEIYLGLGLPRDLLLAGLKSGRLRWIHTGAAGVASLLHPELLASDVVLTNSAGIHAEPIAETVMAMVLYFARGIDHAVAAQHRREWLPGAYERSDSGVREVTGMTLGIVGFGGIGREVARRGHALGMRPIAVRRSATDDNAAEMITGADALGRLLERSDVVVLTVPATAETRGMIAAGELGRMKRDAVLINVARGSVLDEDALVEVLQRGHLRGAGLDVFAAEPLPPESLLWQIPNVLITPHVSATTPRYWEREADLILENLRRYVAADELLNIVDTTAGY